MNVHKLSHEFRPPMMSTTGYPPAQGQLYTQSVDPSTTTFDMKNTQEPPLLSRTPSPTPSEQKELDTGAIDWKTISKLKFWFRREWLWYYVVFILILAITALVTIYHTQIVHALSPVTQWLHSFKFGWLVPIAVLFVLSFPPLFGHEIVAILCGLVWGLWIGFGIVAAGTFVGEVGNFYAFKYCCRARGVKLERTKMSYACLARVVRDGGFKIALIARLSAIPGHFTTAIFSTCGMGIIVFSLAAILSLPKQFITVYLGVILDANNATNTKSRIISDSVLAVTFIITFVAMWYIYHQMNKAKPLVIYDRRKARQAKLMRGLNPEASGSTVNMIYGHNSSDSDIPLTVEQQWHSQRKATASYDSDPEVNQIYAPKPMMNNEVFLPLNNPRDIEESGSHSRNDSTYSVGWESNPQQKRGYATPPNPQPYTQRPNFQADVGQTPTQATFVNTYPGPQAYRPESPSDEDAYGGYRAVTPPAAGRGIHFQGPTNATFATALTGSPTEHHDDLPNPYAQPNPSSASHQFSPAPPSYSTQSRTPMR